MGSRGARGVSVKYYYIYNVQEVEMRTLFKAVTFQK